MSKSSMQNILHLDLEAEEKRNYEEYTFNVLFWFRVLFKTGYGRFFYKKNNVMGVCFIKTKVMGVVL